MSVVFLKKTYFFKISVDVDVQAHMTINAAGIFGLKEVDGVCCQNGLCMNKKFFY